MMKLCSSLNAGQIAFIIIVPLVVSVGVFFLIYFPIRKKKMKENFRYFYYRYIYKIALDNDYYLINDFHFRIDERHIAIIDHILFANKYIYIITDNYFDGDIDGKENDPSIILIGRTGKKVYTDNIIINNARLIKKLSVITGIGQSLMIGINLVNNNCNCAVKTTAKNAYIIQANKFRNLVKAIESRPIGDINKEQLDAAVKAVNKLNRKKKANAKK